MNNLLRKFWTPKKGRTRVMLSQQQFIAGLTATVVGTVCSQLGIPFDKLDKKAQASIGRKARSLAQAISAAYHTKKPTTNQEEK